MRPAAQKQERERAVRHRDEPRTLVRLSGTFEGYVASLLVNSAGLVVLATMAIEDGLPVVLTALLAGWCLLNIAIRRHDVRRGGPVEDPAVDSVG